MSTHPLRGRRHNGPDVSHQVRLRRARRVLELEGRHWRLCREHAALWWVALELGNTVSSLWGNVEAWEQAYELGKQAEYACLYRDEKIIQLRQELARLGVDEEDVRGAGGVVDLATAAVALAEIDWWRDQVEIVRVDDGWAARPK